MKRYVKEFANDRKHPKTPEKNKRIDEALSDYEQGFFTPFEAVRMITDICLDSSEDYN